MGSADPLDPSLLFFFSLRDRHKPEYGGGSFPSSSSVPCCASAAAAARFLRRRSSRTTAAMVETMPMTPSEMPTPMPIFAPVVRPDEEEAVAEGVAVWEPPAALAPRPAVAELVAVWYEGVMIWPLQVMVNLPGSRSSSLQVYWSPSRSE